MFKGPRLWYKTVREIYMILRMHNAFSRGLMEYGMVRGRKLPSGVIRVETTEAKPATGVATATAAA